MKKKFLALVLTLAIVLSLVPVTALAVGKNSPVTEVSTDANSPVQIKKSVNKEGDMLTLEAYLTNEVTQTVSAKPLDIVLVLDQSGSMAYDFDGETTSNYSDTRQCAMKSAVVNFVDKVNEQYSEKGDHRMAIVTFGSEASTLHDWTAVDTTGAASLKDKVNTLPQEPTGATNVGAGMEMAKGLMNSVPASSNTTHQKVVIVFTDGVPTKKSDFSINVANAAITASKDMKDAGAVVYTVGIFNGANPDEMYGASGFNTNSDGTIDSVWRQDEVGLFPDFPTVDRPAGNRFLNLVSNNYPAADSIGLKRETYGLGILYYGVSYTITQNFDRTASNYYLTATNADGLNSVFEKIIEEISTLEIEAGTDAILSDTLSEYFDLNIPEGATAESAITVKQWNCTGKDANGYTWTKASTQPEMQIDVTGKTVKVTGFDYTANAVTKTTSGSGAVYSGSKLVVTILIKPDTAYTNWKKGNNLYPTNNTSDNKAGLSNYKDKNGGTLPSTLLKESPKAKVTAYTVTYEWGDIKNATTVTDDQYYINGQTAQVKGTVSAGTAVQGTDGQWYRFNGWSLDGENVIKSVAITNSNVILKPVLGQKIVQDAIVVTITGKNDTVKYDGTEKSVSGYDVTITKDGEAYSDYTTRDFTFSGTAEAKGTDVEDGGYSMGLKEEDFANTNSQFTNVTFVVVDGKLTIQPRTVTMTSGDATKPWDDTPLTNATVTVTGDGFVEGEGANYTVTGSRTELGASDNTFTYTLKDGTTASNYDITTKFGKLTITEKAEVPYTLIFNANDGAWDIEEISGYALNTEKNQATKSGLAASYRVDTSTVTEPKKENATFLGWGTTEGILPNLILKPTVAALKHQLGGDGNTVTLYAVWKTEETTDPAGNCTYTIRQHYWKNLNDTDTGDNVSIENLTAKSSKTIASLIDGKNKNQDWRGYRYLYDNQQTKVTVPGEESTKLTDGAVLSVSGTVIDLYYYLDSWKDGNTQDSAGKDEKTGGDGTPDYKQILIEYKAHTPLVGEVSCEFEIQTLKDNQTVATPTGAKATAKTDSVYAFAYWIKGEVDPKKTEAEIENTAICYENQLSGVTIDPVTGGGTYIYTAVFLKDVTGKIEEGKEKPDGIPDAWQCKVTFKVENGSWDDNTNKDIVKYVTKKNAEGNGSTNGTAKLTAGQIPPVGNQPSSGYKASGSWDKTPPTDFNITGDTVFTYTYDQKSGGSGSGGSNRPKPPVVEIPDDVPTGLNGKDHYAYVVGYPDGMVYPQKNITRAEVATIFFRLLTDETREANMTKSNGYNDMKDGAWYTCAVSTLSKMGIIKGYEDGSFKPDASISRAEFAAIAARFDPDGDKTPATFSDVSSHWAKDEISIAANHGWIKGYEDGSFKPDQKITRAETMTLVNRVLKRLPETKDDLHKDMKTWPDNQKESAWFYLAVQEATNSHYQKLKKDGTHEKWESMRETRDWAALEK